MSFLHRPDGSRLYYEVHGPASAPSVPLVLLEGLGGDISGWWRNIPRLSERRTVIAHDVRGNGRSDAPDQPMTVATFVEDTVALLRVPKDRPYLALYSDAFAREHPDQVAEDILVGSQNPQPSHAGRRQWEATQPEAADRAVLTFLGRLE
jgi:pimeloyl-ACP methyl ester carboxylesterase